MARCGMEYYNNRRVLITGHTGFKGSWLCAILKSLGAIVTGYALDPPTQPSLFELGNIADVINSIKGDVRDLDSMMKVFQEFMPEIVIHMAAQPLVIESYKNPVVTYATNVMGTVNVLECVRRSNSVISVVNVTTDKVYQNKEWSRGYVEEDMLNGYDPYSNSKSCSELVTDSYRKSFLSDMGIAVSTCRAGNVIGGGDYADNRIIPDCVRATISDKIIKVRNPLSVRPYQHVIEPLIAYLILAKEQINEANIASCYNIGPDDDNCVTTGELVDIFCRAWGDGVARENLVKSGVHEAQFLKLDCEKFKNKFGWRPRWNICEAIDMVVEFEKVRLGNGNVYECMLEQIRKYIL